MVRCVVDDSERPRTEIQSPQPQGAVRVLADGGFFKKSCRFSSIQGCQSKQIRRLAVPPRR